ncbi:enoyl-CoA hydratase/isomerase family protein [Peribacillus sp. NPDC097206]|uniref:enoyl-CoA hydratase/isomerase family protein n=1 Tax=unclassified Peribacillus TaxID=2675266 RepID=UPI0038060722
MENEAVIMQVNNGIATITLNEPNSLNALSGAIIEKLNHFFNSIKNDSSIRAVILTGNGRSFCAGGDIKGFSKVTSAASGRKYMQKHSSFLKELVNMEKPVIAAVNGFAIGAGFSIAIACDIVIASSKAKFGLNFNKVGLVPDLGALYHLPRIVGMARAKELAFSDRILSASEAKDYGICLEVVEEDNLLNFCTDLANSFVANPPIAIGLTKTMLNHSMESSLEDILNEEAMVQGIVFNTQDHQEGVRAFIDKTKPNFTGSYQ